MKKRKTNESIDDQKIVKKHKTALLSKDKIDETKQKDRTSGRNINYLSNDLISKIVTTNFIDKYVISSISIVCKKWNICIETKIKYLLVWSYRRYLSLINPGPICRLGYHIRYFTEMVDGKCVYFMINPNKMSDMINLIYNHRDKFQVLFDELNKDPKLGENKWIIPERNKISNRDGLGIAPCVEMLFNECKFVELCKSLGFKEFFGFNRCLYFQEILRDKQGIWQVYDNMYRANFAMSSFVNYSWFVQEKIRAVYRRKGEALPIGCVLREMTTLGLSSLITVY